MLDLLLNEHHHHRVKVDSPTNTSRTSLLFKTKYEIFKSYGY